MKAIDFPEANVNIAADQPQYETLPALYDKNEGVVVFCFEFSPEELLQLINTKRLWIVQTTFNRPMQPISPRIEKPI